jgi:acyl-CoA thioesterase-2
MQHIEELVDLIQLERLDKNLFRGQNYQAPWGRVFGGQVLAQSLYAATQTVPAERLVHSVHGYFMLPGQLDHPIIYDVDRIRDGRSFTTRRVVAIQEGQAIFSLSASFQLEEAGLEHQGQMPDVPGPEALKSDAELLAAIPKEKIPYFARSILHPRPIEFRPVEGLSLEGSRTLRHYWIKANGELPEEPTLHQQLLLYASDYNLISTSLLPHLEQIYDKSLQLASLDHALWFHYPVRFDDWLLVRLETLGASNARGLSQASIFSADGQLIATANQEGLMRLRRD